MRSSCSPASRRRRMLSSLRHRRLRGLHAEQSDRERVVAKLLLAERRLSVDAFGASLLLDGVLADLLACWASSAGIAPADSIAALDAMDVVAPVVAARVRLALQAHDAAARLAHYWIVLDLLTDSTTAVALNAQR